MPVYKLPEFQVPSWQCELSAARGILPDSAQYAAWVSRAGHEYTNADADSRPIAHAARGGGCHVVYGIRRGREGHNRKTSGLGLARVEVRVAIRVPRQVKVVGASISSPWEWLLIPACSVFSTVMMP